MSITRRKDNKGRVLNENEFQKSDGRYEYRYRDLNGKSRSVYSWKLTASDRLPKGRRECQPRRELEQELERADFDGINMYEAGRTSLNDCFDKYIESKCELRESTKSNYIYMYNKHIRNGLGGRMMSNFKYSTILTFYKELIYKKGFMPNSMETIHTILHPIFKSAVRDGLIRTNPTTGAMKEIKGLKEWKEQPKRESLTKAQQKVFMDYVANSKTYNKWLNAFTVLFWTGLRIGEFTGLTWNDCDFKKGIISVNHTLLYRPTKNGECEFTIHEPKTKSGIRTIPMLEPVRNALLSEKKRQEENGTVRIEIDGYSDWTFTNRYGTVMQPSSINRAIKRIIKSYNDEETTNAQSKNREPVLLPDFSAHTMRHTFCTRMCEVEPRVKIIQVIMGHSDIQTTMDIYNTVTDEVKFESFDGLATKLFTA